MSNTDTVVQSYIAMWNETEPAGRRELVAETVTDDARYVDPLMSGAGVDGISEMIAGAQQQALARGAGPGTREAGRERCPIAPLSHPTSGPRRDPGSATPRRRDAAR
jgi:hypothetical protein